MTAAAAAFMGRAAAEQAGAVGKPDLLAGDLGSVFADDINVIEAAQRCLFLRNGQSLFDDLRLRVHTEESLIACFLFQNFFINQRQILLLQNITDDLAASISSKDTSIDGSKLWFMVYPPVSFVAYMYRLYYIEKTS